MATDRRVTFLIGANIQNFTKGLNKAQRSFEKFGRSMERMGSKLTRNVTAPLVALGGASVKSAIDFESAFAGVRKTVDATEEEFAGLRKGILDMSKELPTSANEIAGVAEAAGQLGIRTDAILDFSRTMVMLGDTTNIAADEAATALARIANIMQLPQDQFDEMGSVIVDLGNNFATTESEIVDFAQRIAGAGQIAGLAASDIFGIATAMTSVGVEAGLGGTAVQKVMLAINEAVATGDSKLKTFAETAGVSAKQFETMWRDDAAQGFAAFVNGLGEQGDDASGTLRELGLADQRLMRAFLSLANAGDLVNRTLETGTEAWEENTALTKEAEQRYNTIASRLSVLKNRIVALGISIGDALMPFVERTIEVVNNLTERFENLGSESKVQILKMAGLLAISGPLMIALSKAGKIVFGFAKLVRSQFAIIIGAFAAGVGIGQWFTDNWNRLFGDAETEFTGFIESTKKGMKKIIDPLIEFAETALGAGSAMEEFEKLFKESGESFEESASGVERSANRASNALERLLHLQSKVDPTTRQGLSGSSVGAGETPEGKLRRAEKQTNRMSESLRLALGLVPGQAGEATDGLDDMSGALQFANEIAHNFTMSFGQGMTNLIVQGQRFVDVLSNIGRLLASSILQTGIRLLLTGGLSGATGFFGSGGGLFGKIFGVNDALITSGGDVVQFHPDDNILAMKDFSGLAPAFAGGGQVIENIINIDGETFYRNQREVSRRRKR